MSAEESVENDAGKLKNPFSSEGNAFEETPLRHGNNNFPDAKRGGRNLKVIGGALVERGKFSSESRKSEGENEVRANWEGN